MYPYLYSQLSCQNISNLSPLKNFAIARHGLEIFERGSYACYKTGFGKFALKRYDKYYNVLKMEYFLLDKRNEIRES